MSSFGTVYSFQGNPRTTALRIIDKQNNLNLKYVEENPAKGVSEEYKKKFPLGKIPGFEGADGLLLFECNAIAIYLASQNPSTKLLGLTKRDYASILQWMSYANTEVLPSIAGWFRPLVGREPYNKKSVESYQERVAAVSQLVERYLQNVTYLVGNRITLADIVMAGHYARGFEFVLDKEWRKDYPNLVRWFTTVVNQKIFTEVAGEPKLVEEAVKYTPPKKEQPQKEQKSAKGAAAAAAGAGAGAAGAGAAATATSADTSDEPAPAPKPKHPLAELPPASLALDEWKRKYSNEETREVALPWFWEHFKPDEYSLWKVDYKYNDELTLLFMSSNLVGGFFNRLGASTKYIFGSMLVCGENNKNGLTGAFVIRGQDAEAAFNVAPDWESYSYQKLDPSKSEDKEFVENAWAWDKPLPINGELKTVADGKVLK